MRRSSPMVHLPFKDRNSAGDHLARALCRYRGREGLIVLALPRGGVPVAAKVAESLDAPLDVMIVRKLGMPGHEELAMGAIASGGIRVLNEELVTIAGIDDETIEEVTRRELAEMERRERAYHGSRERTSLKGRPVMLVDDGLATGNTMKAAVLAVRAEGASLVVVAVPVAAYDTVEALCRVADDVVCLRTPEPFNGVGLWYEDFSQTTDEEVLSLLQHAWTRSPESNIK